MSSFLDNHGRLSVRILLIHPNYHSGGAEIAGHWPPAWAPYLAGALKANGFTDLKFIDAMTEDTSDEKHAKNIADDMGISSK